MLNHSNGYVAIASLLVITALITLIGTSVTLLSIDEGITALSYKQGMDAMALTQACAEEALLKINESGNTPSSITLPIGTCSVTNASTSGTLHTFTVSGSKDGHTRRFYMEVLRETVTKVRLWQEN